MIQVDISNIWGEVSLPDLLSLEKEIFDAHQVLTDGTGAGSDYRGWLQPSAGEAADEIIRIRAAAEQIRATSDAFVVIGVGGSCLGARAAIELLQGSSRNLDAGRGNPQIFFAGNSLSTRSWNELQRLLEGKDFSICIVSKSGTTLEPAIATRALRWMLERKYGTEKARRRIYAITDPVSGPLRQLASEEGWETFHIPPNISGRFGVLSAAGLLPMAVAGIDITQVVKGAADAAAEYDLRSFENPVWLYVAVRNLMYRHGKAIELLNAFESGFRSFGAWWQKLFAETEGKRHQGLFPVCAEFTADLYTLGQFLQQGQRNLFETMMRFDPPMQKCAIVSDYRNLDGLNDLADLTLDFVQEQAFGGTLNAHVDGGVPVITMDCGELNAEKLGELFYFFQLSCAISAYMQGVNPFNQPGTEVCRRNLFTLLGQPGYEP